MQTIVIGYDGSEEAKDALRLAADMRAATGAQLVVAPVDEIEPYYGDLNLEQLNEARDEYFKRMFDEAAKEIGDSDFKRSVGNGSAPAALEQIAEQVEADVIVVGSTHRAGLSTVLPGSTADRLLSGASCAIAVAPRGYANETDRGLARIGVAYDGQAESKVALRAAVALAAQEGGTVRLIAVNQDPAQISRGHGGSISPEAYTDTLRGYLDEKLTEGLASIPKEIESSSEIVTGDPAEQLGAEGARLDLLVIGSRGYGPVRRVLLGGTAHKVIHAATCPVMVVPRGTEKVSKDAHPHRIDEVVV
jgi:nucleotide-binding universal stress UspA family protein